MPRLVLIRLAPAFVFAALACGAPFAAVAQRHNGTDLANALSPGFSQNAVHDPSSPNYNAMLPSNIGWRTFSSGASIGNTFYGGVVYGTGGLFYGVNYPYYAPYGYGYGYPNYYPRAYYGGIAPWAAPVVAPQVAPVAPAVGAVAMNGAGKNGVGGFGVLAPEPPAEKAARVKPRASSVEGKARAQRQIELGDASFSRQSYLDATQHYRSAGNAAADMAAPLFRQGFSLFALGRYDQAAKMFRKALEMDPDWPTSGFQMSALYGDNQLSKGAHLDALAQAVTKGQNSDLLFLLGLMLYADGEPERARPFLLRARDLNVGDVAHIAGFLKQLEPAPAPAAPVARAIPVAAEKPPAAMDAQPAAKPAPVRPARPGSVDL